MSVRAKTPPYNDIARRWRDLAERRRAYYVDLYESGRWQRYYSEAKFLSEMREAVKAAEEWAKIASHDDPVTEPSE